MKYPHRLRMTPQDSHTGTSVYMKGHY
jgi:hypothetical protein